MGIAYAQSKLTIALGYRSAGTETLQERLRQAYVYSYMHGLHDSEVGDYLPEGTQQRMKLLSDRLTTVDGEEGSAQATASAMSDEEAKECATEMTQLALEVVRQRQGILTRSARADFVNGFVNGTRRDRLDSPG